MRQSEEMQLYTPSSIKTQTSLLSLCLPLVLVLLGGCAVQPSLDRSLLTDAPCAAPCWHNLTPGQSDEYDVSRALETSPLVKEGTLTHGPTVQAGVPLVMFAWQDRGNGPNRIYLRDGKVLRIEIRLDYELTLNEVMTKYGPPESVYAAVGGDDFWGYSVVLGYPAKGLTFSSFSYPVNYDDVVVREGTGVLSEDLTVTKVDYYAPTSLEHALLDAYLYTPEAVDAILSDVQEWHGFGEVALADRDRW